MNGRQREKDLAELFAEQRQEVTAPQALADGIRSHVRDRYRQRRAHRRRLVLLSGTVGVLVLCFAISPPQLGGDANRIAGFEFDGDYVGVIDEFGRDAHGTSPELVPHAQELMDAARMNAGRPANLIFIRIGDEQRISYGREVVIDGEAYFVTSNTPEGMVDTMSRQTTRVYIANADAIHALPNDPDAFYIGWEVYTVDDVEFKVHFWAGFIPGVGRVVYGEGHAPTIPR